MRSNYPEDTFLATPDNELGRTIALWVWMLAAAPKITQDALFSTKISVDEGLTNAPTKVLREHVQSQVQIYAAHLTKGYMNARPRASYFDIGMNWDDICRASLALSKRTNFDRCEPLMYPELQPPDNVTHMSGRYIKRPRDSKAIWINYRPCNKSEMYDTPPNVSMHPNHWVGRTLPGESRPLQSMDELVRIIQTFRTKQGLSNADTISSRNLHVPRRSYSQPADHIVNPLRGIPEDASYRTPIRYAAAPHGPGSGYSGFSPWGSEPEPESDPKTISPMRKQDSDGHSQDIRRDQGSDTHQPDHRRLPRTNQPSNRVIPPYVNDNAGNDTFQSSMSASINDFSFQPNPSQDHPETLIPDEYKPSFLSSRRFNVDESTQGDHSGRNQSDQLFPRVHHPSQSDRRFHDNGSQFGTSDTNVFRPPLNASGTPFTTSQPDYYRNGYGRPAITPHRVSFHSSTNYRNSSTQTARPPQSRTPTGNQPPRSPFPRVIPPRGPPSQHSPSQPGTPHPRKTPGDRGSGNPSGPPAPDGDGSGDPYGHHTYNTPPYQPKIWKLKPDLKYFPKFNHENEYRSWNETFDAVCNGFDLGECIDPNYVPTPEEYPSFSNKIKYLYVVLLNTVKIPRAGPILYDHNNTSDGRAVYFAICRMLTHSSAVSYDSGKLFEEVVNMKLDRTWRRSVAEFISTFQGKIARYNNMVFNVSERLQPEMVKNMLQRAVSSQRGLRDVKDREEHRIAEGSTPLPLSSYLQLLIVAAEGIDRERRSSRHESNAHQFDDANTDSPPDDLTAYDINYAAGSRMNLSTWKGLSKDAQTAWDTLPDDDKAKILGYAESRAARSPTTSGSSDRPTRSTNVTDITADDTDPDGPLPDVEPPDDSSSPLQINKAIQSSKTADRINEAKGSVHPGDIRRVLGRQLPATPPKDSSTTGGDAAPPALKSNLKSANRTTNASNIHWNVNHTEISTACEDELDSWGEPSGVPRYNPNAQFSVNNVWTHQSDDESESDSSTLFR